MRREMCGGVQCIYWVDNTSVAEHQAVCDLKVGRWKWITNKLHISGQLRSTMEEGLKGCTVLLPYESAQRIQVQ